MRETNCSRQSQKDPSKTFVNCVKYRQGKELCSTECLQALSPATRVGAANCSSLSVAVFSPVAEEETLRSNGCHKTLLYVRRVFRLLRRTYKVGR